MTNIAILASDAPEAQAAAADLRARYGDSPAAAADVIVALGGDGLMLEALHRNMGTGKPIYGMNRGSVASARSFRSFAPPLERHRNVASASPLTQC